MNKSFKKFSFLFSSAFIILIHLPFVFAKTIPAVNSFPDKTITDSASLNFNETHPASMVSMYDSLHLNELMLNRKAFEDALKGYKKLRSAGKLSNDSVISIIDFTLSSAKKRLFVLDIKNYKILFNTYVAHGRNSGQEYAKRFSNGLSSNKSSLGFYITGNTYFGEHGYSLKLEGEEMGINNNAYKRAIVMHCADYVNEDYINNKGCIGRSYGCPAIPEENYKPIIDHIKNGSCLFLYSPDHFYLSHSRFLKQAS